MVKAYEKLNEMYDVDGTMDEVEENAPAVPEEQSTELANPEDVNSELSDDEREYNQDIDTAKSNLRNILSEGEGAISQMRGIAEATEHPRAYEVMATMMRTMVDANKSLVDISEKKVKPKKNDSASEGQSTNTTNNNVILTGNAQDALEQLHELRRKKNETE